MVAPLPSRATTPSGSIPRSPAPRPTEAGRPGRTGVDLSLVVGRRGAAESPVIDEPFAVAFRGYDRQQVDDRIEDLKGRVGRLRIRAEAAEAELNAALSRLKDVDAAPPAETEPGFGVRVEKVLRLAEQEAAEVRTKAAKEAGEVLERARAEAEALRRNAERDAAAEVGRADERAKRLLADAEKAAQQQREAAEREVQRLSGIRDDVRSQMADLQRVLADGLGDAVGAAAKKAPARA